MEERISKQLALLLSLMSFVHLGQAVKLWNGTTCMKNALGFISRSVAEKTCYGIKYGGMIKEFPNADDATCQKCSVEAAFDNKYEHDVKGVNALFLFTLMQKEETFYEKIVKNSRCWWGGITIQIRCHIKENLAFGTTCISHHQCAGDNTICNSTFRCDCVENGLHLNGNCFKGNKSIGDPCTLSGQCAGHGTVCDLSRICSCKEGYRKANNHCIKIALNDACEHDYDCYWSDLICANNVCSCKEDSIYLKDERKCVKVSLPIGSICQHNEQCISHNCIKKMTSKICTCQTNMIQIGESCLTGNIELGQECKYHQQCTGTKFAWLCTGSNPGRKVCSCLKGLMKHNNEECVQGNLHVGAYCNYNMQCKATPNANICSDHSCSCKPGYIQKGNICIEGNLHVGAYCNYSMQCEATPNANICSNHSCSCKPGYIQKGNICIEGNLQIGAFCNHDLQCVATANATTCSNHSCSCDRGFVQQGSNCIEESSTNTQAITQEVADSSNDVGVTTGAFLGGLVLGAVIVLAVILILYHRRNKFQKKYGKNEQSAVSNQSYDNEIRFESQTKNQRRSVLYSNVENESMQPKVSLVTPICKQMDSINPKADSKDEIYNHLNEKEGDERDDTYDHAHPVQGACLLPSDEDAYMHVQMTDGRDVNDKTIENQDAEDDYFTLEKEQT